MLQFKRKRVKKRSLKVDYSSVRTISMPKKKSSLVSMRVKMVIIQQRKREFEEEIVAVTLSRAIKT